MSFDAFRGNKILAKISEFTVFTLFVNKTHRKQIIVFKIYLIQIHLLQNFEAAFQKNAGAVLKKDIES